MSEKQASAWSARGDDVHASVERDFSAPVHAPGRTYLGEVLCSVYPTEGLIDGEPPRTAKENAHRIARALNASGRVVCSWCGEEGARDPVAMVDHILACEKRQDPLANAIGAVHCLRGMLTKHQWSGEVRIDYDDGAACCPECGGLDPKDSHVERGRTDGNPVGHTDSCELAEMLRVLGPSEEPST